MKVRCPYGRSQDQPNSLRKFQPIGIHSPLAGVHDIEFPMIDLVNDLNALDWINSNLGVFWSDYDSEMQMSWNKEHDCFCQHCIVDDTLVACPHNYLPLPVKLPPYQAFFTMHVGVNVALAEE